MLSIETMIVRMQFESWMRNPGWVKRWFKWRRKIAALEAISRSV